MDCELSTAKVKLWLDVNFGDPVTPAPRALELPSQRPGIPGVPVLGYPIETVLAEKSSTAIALGDTSTRVRDYVDLYTLTGRQALSYQSVRSALEATTSHRGVELQPLSAVLGDFVSLREAPITRSGGGSAQMACTCPTASGTSWLLWSSSWIRWPPEIFERLGIRTLGSGRRALHRHAGYAGATSA